MNDIIPRVSILLGNASVWSSQPVDTHHIKLIILITEFWKFYFAWLGFMFRRFRMSSTRKKLHMLHLIYVTLHSLFMRWNICSISYMSACSSLYICDGPYVPAHVSPCTVYLWDGTYVPSHISQRAVVYVYAMEHMFQLMCHPTKFIYEMEHMFHLI
jgi:hypothetical protein